MKMPAASKAPSLAVLIGTLGPAHVLWRKLIDTLAGELPPLEEVWRPTKVSFGQVCLLTRKQRTLLYLFPGDAKFEVAIILGERAYGLLQASDLPAAIKQLFTAARPYAEGRGIRFTVTLPAQVRAVRQLVGIKTTPI